MTYRLIIKTPLFAKGYIFDSENPESPAQLLRYFVAHPEWFELVIN